MEEGPSDISESSHESNWGSLQAHIVPLEDVLPHSSIAMSHTVL